ncbi:MAG: DUF4326 domain-containing protein [Chloroflexi bacterium]|nr:DUF4326 domain-containing protein [Chloroflexota bacterium]
MTDPMHRIQRKRTKGWRMPEGAVYVGRPTRWGNYLLPTMLDLHDRPLGVERSIEMYRLATLRFIEDCPDRGEVESWLAPLRGRDLACWCPLVDANGDPVPCHADVLLEIVAATPEGADR